MKLFCVRKHDNFDGTNLFWTTTRLRAQRELRMFQKSQRELGRTVSGLSEVVEVEFPRGRDEVVAWLNKNYKTDNG